jgi:hypothetical protein
MSYPAQGCHKVKPFDFHLSARVMTLLNGAIALRVCASNLTRFEPTAALLCEDHRRRLRDQIDG